MKRYVIVGAIAGVILIGVVATRRGERAGAATHAGADSSQVVELGKSDLAQAARVDLIAGVPVSGTLDPSVVVRISSPIPEVVDAVLVREGEAVRAGQALARFRTNAVEPAALSAEAQRRLAASDYERMQSLFKEGAVSQRDVENAEVTLRAAESGEALAKKKLNESTIRAPTGGVISQRAVDSGDRVKDGDLMFQLVNTVGARVRGHGPERVRRRRPCGSLGRARGVGRHGRRSERSRVARECHRRSRDPAGQGLRDGVER